MPIANPTSIFPENVASGPLPVKMRSRTVFRGDVPFGLDCNLKGSFDKRAGDNGCRPVALIVNFVENRSSIVGNVT